jgi:hypothetical protein
MTPDQQSRLTRLETQLVRTRWILAIVILGIAGLFSLNRFTEHTGVLETQGVIVRDKQGRPRWHVGVGGGESYLHVYDSEGLLRSQFVVGPYDTSVTFHDQKTKAIAALTVSEAAVSLVLDDDTGNTAATLRYARGPRKIGSGSSVSSGSLAVVDKQGQVLFSWPE